MKNDLEVHRATRNQIDKQRTESAIQNLQSVPAIEKSSNSDSSGIRSPYHEETRSSKQSPARPMFDYHLCLSFYSILLSL